MKCLFQDAARLKKLIDELQSHFAEEKIQEVYSILHKNTQILQEKLPEGGYPSNPISGDVWVLGAQIYDFCYDVFEIVKNHTDFEMQHKFFSIWSEATLGVVPHYRLNVGAVMTEVMYFYERKGEYAAIPLLAQAIFNDFEFLIDEIVVENRDFDTIGGINYLIIACEKMLKYGDAEGKQQANRILETIKHLPESIQKLLDYDFNYKKGGKMLPGENVSS